MHRPCQTVGDSAPCTGFGGPTARGQPGRQSAKALARVEGWRLENETRRDRELASPSAHMDESSSRLATSRNSVGVLCLAAYDLKEWLDTERLGRFIGTKHFAKPNPPRSFLDREMSFADADRSSRSK